MLKKLSAVKKQKGQGIVEYALLLAFILGIAIAMQGSAIDKAIADTFTRVAQALGVETEQDQWATADISTIFGDKESAARRLQADQNFLKDIGQLFIGMDKETLIQTLNVPEKTLDGVNNSNGILLGNFTEGLDANGNWITDYSNKLRKEKTIPQTGELFNLKLGSAEILNYDSSKRYFVSDYALRNIKDFKETGCGIKIMKIEYNSDNTVKSINLAVNPTQGHEDKNAGYQRSDLNVTVTQGDKKN